MNESEIILINFAVHSTLLLGFALLICYFLKQEYLYLKSNILKATAVILLLIPFYSYFSPEKIISIAETIPSIDDYKVAPVGNPNTTPIAFTSEPLAESPIEKVTQKPVKNAVIQAPVTSNNLSLNISWFRIFLVISILLALKEAISYWLIKRKINRLPDYELNYGSFTKVKVSSKNNSPYVIGFLKPYLVIPESLINEDPMVIRSVVLHENGHLQNGDHRTVFLYRSLFCLYYWNPLFQFYLKKCSELQESLADNEVIREISPKVYAGILLHLAEKQSSEKGEVNSAALAISSSVTYKRVKKLIIKGKNMNLRPGKRETFIWGVFFAALCIAAITVQAIDKEKTVINSSVKMNLPNELKNRAPKARSQALKKYGSQAGYNNIVKAFDWFIQVQNPDGSWGNTSQVAQTSFVILSFLTHAEIINSDKYGSSVKKAIKWLVEQKIDLKKFHGYPHAIKTSALCEAHAITGSYEKQMNEAVQVLINGQQKEGSYNYNYNVDEGRQDLSFAAWNYQALRSASIAGCKLKDLQKTIQNAVEWLKGSTAGDFQFSYSTSQNSFKTNKAKHTMRAAGTYSLQILSKENALGLRDELKTISTDDLKELSWENPPKSSLYGWYYATQVMFVENRNWRSWNKKLLNEIKGGQDEKGFWVYPGVSHAPKDHLTNKVYATSLCVLMLSSSFRYSKK
jgi:beta-lactamase regulating signal transducer with metallopeptidase domain